MPHEYDTFGMVDARCADVDGDGIKEVLLPIDNTIEARNGFTGSLVRVFTFDANVTDFELADVGIVDEDGDGSVGVADLLELLDNRGPCP